jgi:hypothetical protein
MLMTPTFTPNDMVSYLYGEAELELAITIEQALAHSSKLRRVLSELQALKGDISRAGLSPQDLAVNQGTRSAEKLANLFAYSRATALAVAG